MLAPGPTDPYRFVLRGQPRGLSAHAFHAPWRAAADARYFLRGLADRPHFAATQSCVGCIILGHLLVALTRVGHFHLKHQTSTPYDAGTCVPGIGRRKIIIILASFSGFFLAYFGLSGRRALAVARLGGTSPLDWGTRAYSNVAPTETSTYGLSAFRFLR